MLNLLNRTIDDDGNVIYNQQGLLDYLYKFKQFPNEILYLENDDTIRFNEFSNYFNVSDKLNLPKSLKTHEERKNNWFMPEKYYDINLSEYFNNLCHTEEEHQRVNIELTEYKNTGMELLLRYMIFLMDYIKENKYVLGVGRGSSVCSYCLYLIGVHKIDSIKYDLNIKEFLK